MADYVQFLGNHVFASILGAIGVILYALGIAEQANVIATKFRAWHFQALGMGFFFIFITMVQVSYDTKRRTIENATPTVSPANVSIQANSDPSILPMDIAAHYVELVSSGKTDFQIQRFLKDYEGKYLDLSLEMASLDQDKRGLRGQFYAGSSPTVFATFKPEWADHLEGKNVGDVIAFRAKIIRNSAARYELGEAKPL